MPGTKSPHYRTRRAGVSGSLKGYGVNIQLSKSERDLVAAVQAALDVPMTTFLRAAVLHYLSCGAVDPGVQAALDRFRSPGSGPAGPVRDL